MLNVCLRVPRRRGQHLEQLLIGFCRLAHRRDVKVDFHTMSSAEEAAGADLAAVLNGRWRILYDVKDGYGFYSGGKNVYREVMNRLLDGCDFYFKRSCRPSFNEGLKEPQKVLPLGLNLGYTVLSVKDSAKFFIKRLLYIDGGPTRPVDVEMLPMFGTTPIVIFLTRVWDPDDIDDFRDEDITAIQNQRIQINEMRAACIRACRSALGPQFIGGLADTPCARRQFPDCIVSDQKSTLRSRYIQLMKQSSIGIASTGLHDSIGWKFAEYVAAAKAIVSEPLLVSVPGSFAKGKNYLEYNNTEDCVNAVLRLLKDEGLRCQIMKNNFEYYRSSLEPSQLVLNSLLLVLARVHGLDHDRCQMAAIEK